MWCPVDYLSTLALRRIVAFDGIETPTDPLIMASVFRFV